MQQNVVGVIMSEFEEKKLKEDEMFTFRKFRQVMNLASEVLQDAADYQDQLKTESKRAEARALMKQFFEGIGYIKIEPN